MMIKKKIGVVTWNASYNYGTNLQAYALCKYLELQGHQVDFIVPILPEIVNKSFVLRLKYFILKILIYARLKKDSRLIQYFRLRNFVEKNFHYVVWSGLSEQEKYSYDLVLAGSDQIWNPNNIQLFNYLDFVPDRIKKCSYASSIGVTSIDEDTKHFYRKYLSCFNNISVRERQGAELLQNCLRRNIAITPDPTFLLSQNEWKKLIGIKKDTSQYALIYFIGDNKDNWDKAKDMLHKKGLPIKVIESLEAKYIPENIDIVKGTGPIEFLQLINNATIFCTDSFHGIVFSILFNTDFWGFKRFNDNEKNSQNSRIYDILDRFGLMHRMVGSSVSLQQSTIKWQQINKISQSEQTIGWEYLNNLLL